MEGICQSCNRNEGLLYEFHYGQIASQSDKNTVSPWNNKSISYKILGKAEVFLCQSCIRKFTISMRMRIWLTSIPLLLFGIFGYLISENYYKLEDFINCSRGVLGGIGFIILLIGFFVESRPDKNENMAIDLAAKTIKLKAKTGATVFFNNKTFSDLVPNHAFAISTTDDSKPQMPEVVQSRNAPLVANTPTLSNITSPPTRTTIFCPNCAQENSPQATICQNCAWPLAEVKKSPEQISSQSGLGYNAQI